MYERQECGTYAARAPTSQRSLADVRVGELVEVGDIVFESLRDLCPTLGVIRGATLRCLGRTPADVVLRRDDGQRIAVDRFYACFIGVRSAAASTRLVDSVGQ